MTLMMYPPEQAQPRICNGFWLTPRSVAAEGLRLLSPAGLNVWPGRLIS